MWGSGHLMQRMGRGRLHMRMVILILDIGVIICAMGREPIRIALGGMRVSGATTSNTASDWNRGRIRPSSRGTTCTGRSAAWARTRGTMGVVTGATGQITGSMGSVASAGAKAGISAAIFIKTRCRALDIICMQMGLSIAASSTRTKNMALANTIGRIIAGIKGTGTRGSNMD